MNPHAPTLSVVIVNWNGLEMTLRCLESLDAQRDVSLEVIVVDNGSADGSAEAIASRGGVRLIANPDNRGFARAANQGIRASRGGNVLLLNNDTVVEDPTALARAVGFLEGRPDAGAVGVRLMNADGTLQHSCGRFLSLWAEVRNSLPMRGLLGPREDLLRYTPGDHLGTRAVDWVMGAFLLVRRDSLEAVGLLDETEFMYGEDYDLCYRLARAGWRTYYLADVAVTHLGNASAARVYSSDERLIRVTRVERSLLARHRTPAYAWAHAVFTTFDRWTKLVTARVAGDRTRAERLRREVAIRRRALRAR